MKGWAFFVLLALISSTYGDNLFFHVSDDQGNNINAASVVLCYDKAMSLNCSKKETDPLGNVSFIVPYGGQAANIALYYDVLKDGLMPYSGSVAMYLENAAVDINNFGGVSLPDFGYLDIPFTAGGLQFISGLFGGSYNASTDGDLRIRLGGETPLNFPGYSGKLCDSALGIPCSDLGIVPQSVNVRLSSIKSGFLSWTDIFPACAQDKNYDLIECACTIVIPNFHFDSILSLISRMFESFFSLPNFLAGGSLVGRLLIWGFSVITPFILIFGIFFFSFVEAYILASIIYLAWAAAFDVLFKQNIIGKGNYLAFIVLFFIFTMGVSFWFLGTGLDLWRPLWGG